MDFMRPENEDQMEMMLMQIEKQFPDFPFPYNNNNSNPINDFPYYQPNPNLPVYSSELAGANPLFIPDNNKRASMAAMREMIFRIAAMQPVHIDPESVKPPKRRNVKISTDPQSVAARHRRERISERIRILQRLVPGGTNMDTASMLEEAIHYLKFLKNQVESLEQVSANGGATAVALGAGFPIGGGYFPMPNFQDPWSS